VKFAIEGHQLSKAEDGHVDGVDLTVEPEQLFDQPSAQRHAHRCRLRVHVQLLVHAALRMVLTLTFIVVADASLAMPSREQREQLLLLSGQRYGGRFDRPDVLKELDDLRGDLGEIGEPPASAALIASNSCAGGAD
jgi:hypothetical protein